MDELPTLIIKMILEHLFNRTIKHRGDDYSFYTEIANVRINKKFYKAFLYLVKEGSYRHNRRDNVFNMIEYVGKELKLILN